ncbi:hypothetical protein [Solirubrobacter soli]|uniref:hypothetical protein n=1 Tax=Solirubrobacter soli TaxID=363832 RepID=UPI000421C618|nr:hypothetical protein [Solirubrobacter soli]
MAARALLVAVLVLICCAPAQAATVARLGTLTLEAAKSHGELCLTLRRSRHYQGSQCGSVPRSPFRPLRVSAELGGDVFAVAVPGSVVVAETDDGAGHRRRLTTSAHRAFAARFILLDDRKTAWVRFYGADGALLGIVDGLRSPDDSDIPPVQVFGDREEGVEAYVEPRIDPTPEQLDRVRMVACVDLANSSGGGSVCDNALSILDACAGQSLVGGVVPSGVAGVRLTLGSGAEVTVATIELPAAFGGSRAIGALAPRGEAVRAAAALDATGQVVAAVDVGTAPGGQPCPGPDAGDDRFDGPFVPVTAPTGVAVGPLLVGEQGDTLCATLEAALVPSDCPSPPVDSDSPSLLRRGSVVAGVLSRDAARVTLVRDRGASITVRTTRYTGRWDVRLFSADVGVRRDVVRVVVRNAAGAVIGTGADRVPHPVGRRVLAQRAGVRLQVAGSPACVSAAFGPGFCTIRNPGTPIDGPFLPYHGAVVVPCDTRVALIYGRFPDELATPTVLLDGGRKLRTRRVSLPGEDAWFAFLPDVGVRGFRAGKRSVPLRLPPASAQCGYRLARSF